MRRRGRGDPEGVGVLSQAIGAVLPAAFAVGLSPFPVIGIVLILAGRQGRRTGLLFTAGWIAGLGTVATLIVIVLGGADDSESPTSAPTIVLLGSSSVLGAVVLYLFGGPRASASWTGSSTS